MHKTKATRKYIADNRFFPVRSFLQRIIFPALLLFSMSGTLCAGIPGGQSIVRRSFIQRFDQDAELSQIIVLNTFQDSLGFIWFGTFDGLYRFDGYEVRKFKYNHLNPYSISNNVVSGILEGPYGNYWIATHDGLNRFDPKSEKFYHYFHDKNDSLSLICNFINTLYLDKKGYLWIGTSEGLSIMDVRTGRIVANYSTLGETESSRKDISKIGLLEGSRILISASSSTVVTDISRRSFRDLQFTPLLSEKNRIISPNDLVLAKDSNNLLWILKNGKIYLLNEKTGETVLFPVNAGPFSTQPNFISNDKEGNIWIGLQEGGVIRIDPGKTILSVSPIKFRKDLRAGSEYILYKFDPAAFLNPTYHIIYKYFFTDRSEILWINTEQGLFRLDLREKPFTWYADFRVKGLSVNNEVSTLAISRNDQLLFGTTNSFAGIIFPKDLAIRPLIKFNSMNAMVTSIYEDPYGIFWVGIMGMGITKVDKRGHILGRLTPEGTGGDHLSFWTVWCLLEDSHQNLWVGTLEGLIKLKLAVTGQNQRKVVKETVYTHTPGDPGSLSDNNIWCLYEDRKGRLWIGTNSGGLNLYHPDTDSFTSFEMDRDDPYALQNQAINVIHEDHKGTLWLGTEYGLAAVKYDGDTAVFRHFTENDGLCNNGITGIEEDHSGNFWISTKSGLSLFTPPADPFEKTERGTFVNYYAGDGLQGDKFNPFAYAQDTNGIIYFGGDNGITAFNPDSVRANPVLPHVNLTHLSVLNNEIEPGDTLNRKYVLRTSIIYAKKIILSYKQNSLSLAFAGTNSAIPEKIIYSYILNGFDRGWNTLTGGLHSVNYTNIPPGEYTFRVKASVTGSQTFGPERILSIVIYPPFWQTLWFKIFALLFLTGMIVSYFRYRTFVLRKQKKILSEQVKLRTQEIEKAREQLEEQNTQILKQKDQIELQNQNLRKLTEIGRNITSSIRVKDIINQVYDSVNQLMDARIFYIGILNQRKKTVTFWGRLYKGTPLRTEVIPLKDESRLSVWCIKNNKIAFLNDIEHNAQQYLGKNTMGYAGEQKPKSAIYIPLVSAAHRVIGILVVKSYKRNAFSNSHLDMLKNMASHISIALENAKAYNEVKEASDKLKQIDRIKTRFFTNISHEFRTPLTLIVSPVRNMIKEAESNGLKPYINDLKLVERNARRLLRLINQLLEISRIEGETLKLSVSKGDLIKALQKIAEPFYIHANYKNLRFTFEGPREGCVCYFDHDKVEKIVYNLLSNAVKYTQEGGSITLSVTFRGVKDNLYARIQVRDTGIGIAPQDLRKIFKRFAQVDNSPNTSATGTGIGLYLTRKLVEIHKGKISVASKKESGTEFTVDLPVSREQFRPEEISEEEHQLEFDTEETPILQDFSRNIRKMHRNMDKRKKTLLIVEDNPDVCFYLADHFEKKFNILIALDGEDGYEQARKQVPDIIVSDIMMPRMDGITLCEKIKTNELTSHIPVILLTARADEKTLKAGYETGADDYVTKPFKIEILAQRIDNLIHLRETLRNKFHSPLVTDLKEVSPTSTDEKLLRRILDSIEKNLSNPEFTIEMLTREAGISRAQLFRKINALTKNHSVSDFIISYRLQVAARLFSQGHTNVSEVAYNVGFKNASHFTTRFKKQYGKTPVNFIKSLK